MLNKLKTRNDNVASQQARRTPKAYNLRRSSVNGSLRVLKGRINKKSCLETLNMLNKSHEKGKFFQSKKLNTARMGYRRNILER